ncbi:ATP-binding protein [Massilia endophytica]|uniref:ATP-binding protein n=1 Tax=Massilia endophytica TaxID=2899220 RepID=UPI001E3ACA1B|nr:ATP-binding protein [Massilia endophytica]UGQ46271.1 ATP-binding protein [Massilia endophytica]
MAARLALILVAGLLVAQGLAFWLTRMERDQSMTQVMVGYIEREVVASVALLDHLPPAEREAWLPRLARRSYSFILGPGIPGQAPDAKLSAEIAQQIAEGIGTRYPLTANMVPGEKERLQVHLQLSDDSPLTIDIRPMPSLPLSGWLPYVLAAQLLVLAGCFYIAVRLATRPLHQLADAADALGPDLKPVRMPEDGPSEVARAARAFNAMQERIASYMAERVQILAAVSHDLQTPITRMRLRVDMMDEEPQQAKLQQDLQEMEGLVKEGVAYARTLHAASEEPCAIDPDSLLESLVLDYQDAGENVSLRGRVGQTLTSRPQALRRIVGNLVDNALKYAGSAEVEAGPPRDGVITLQVLDRGPGIPDDMLEAVFEPFRRLESSRNRQTGGTGLGLAIARQLAQAMDAKLTLHPREGGGLIARLQLRLQGS